MSDSSNELSVQIEVSIDNEIISEKETLQGTIILRGAKKSDDVVLPRSDMSLLQILGSFQNENDRVSVANTPPEMIMSTAGLINISSNNAIVENRVDNDGVCIKGKS